MAVLEQPVGVPLGLASRDLLGDEGDGDAVRRALKEARRLIAHGWVQGVMRQGEAHCLAGALWVAVSEGETWYELIPLVRSAMPRVEPIQTWNDAPGRTQAEVLALLDRALSIAEKE